MARQFLHSNDIQCTIFQILAIRYCLIIFGLLVMHQLQLQYPSLCWYTWAWVKEWAGMWGVSGDYSIWVEIITWITPVFSVLCIKKIWLWMLWLWHTCNSHWYHLCIWVCVCVYRHAYKNRHAYFTFKPAITITFLKFCQNYLVPRNQLWDHRLLSLDQVYLGLFLVGGVFFFPVTEKTYFKVGSRFFFGMHILFCMHMWFSCS